MKRGRKSEAELVALSVVQPRVGADRELASHDRPPPPPHLSAESKAWWHRVLADYEIAEHALRTLQAACESWDLKETARASLVEHGLTFTDDHGMVRPRPEVAIAKKATTIYLRALGALNLKVEPQIVRDCNQQRSSDEDHR
jgi:phage terminase small subunit